jgi:hypothetical protein
LGFDCCLEAVVGVHSVDRVDVLRAILDHLVTNQFIALGRPLSERLQYLLRLLGENPHHVRLFEVQHFNFCQRLIVEPCPLVPEHILVPYVVSLLVNVRNLESALSYVIVLEVLEANAHLSLYDEVHLLNDGSFVPHDRRLAICVFLENTGLQTKDKFLEQRISIEVMLGPEEIPELKEHVIIDVPDSHGPVHVPWQNV